MILGFFAVECIGYIALVMLIERTGGNRCQWYALVGRAESQVEIDPGVLDGLAVKSAQSGEIGSPVENTGVEKVRADAPGF